jgi:large subunit ribosomal protein L4
MRVPVVNMAGETVDELELNDTVFGITPNTAVMHQALRTQALEAKGHRTRSPGQHARTELEGRRRRVWAQASQL